MTRSVVVLFLVLVQTTSFQTHALYTCGTIGNSNEKRVIARRDQMFYLNTANPAPCTGNITSWRVCYYQSVDQSRLRAHWATYAVYRKMGSGAAQQYKRVSGIYRAVRATREVLDRINNRTNPIDGAVLDGFMCYSDSIDGGDSPFIVQAGDVLGVCIFLEPERVLLYQLDIVGEVNGESLLAMPSNVAGCTRSTLPSIIPANQLSIINARRLHLYANIETNLVPCKAALNAVNTSLQQSNIELRTSSISKTISSSTLSVSSMISNSTLSIFPAISSYTLTILPLISSSKLSISSKISSSTLSISPIISSSVLSLCYATYPKMTSTTATLHLTKFALSTPTPKISFPKQDVIGSARLGGIAAGTVVGTLWLLVSLVVIISVKLFLYLKKLKIEREKNSFNLTHNPAYIEESTDDSTQFNVTENVNTTYNIRPVPHLQTLERNVCFHCVKHGHRELQPLHVRGIALNTDQNFANTPPGLGVLPAPPGLGVLPATIVEPQDPDLEEDNHYESIT